MSIKPLAIMLLFMLGLVALLFSHWGRLHPRRVARPAAAIKLETPVKGPPERRE